MSGDSNNDHGSGVAGDQISYTKIELPSKTKIVFPPPKRLEIVLNDRNSINFPDGAEVVFANGMKPGDSIMLRGSSLISTPDRATIVLGQPVKLSPSDGDTLILPDGVSSCWADEFGPNFSIALPTGTMIFFNSQQYRHTTTLSGHFISFNTALTLVGETILPAHATILLGGDIDFFGGTRLPGGVILSNTATLPNGVSFARGTTLPYDFIVPEGMIIPAGTTLLGGTVLRRFTKLPAGTILSDSITIPDGSIRHGNSTLPSLLYEGGRWNFLDAPLW
ncbi:hypothetical protein F5Y06DRAFT_307120 [Hypoxylon sp. FL0890]|nr:hypothetical protein F5Y06DRAFT_307120 [Hypoxylon sp. FL0890]